MTWAGACQPPNRPATESAQPASASRRPGWLRSASTAARACRNARRTGRRSR
jgi:hypothetical protein